MYVTNKKSYYVLLVNRIQIRCFCVSGLLSEEQCKARDVRRKQKSTKSKKSESSSGPTTPNSVCDKSDIEMDSKEKVKLKANIKPETIIEEEPLGKVSEDTRKLVEKLVYLQDKYEFADEKVIQSVNVSKQYCNL